MEKFQAYIATLDFNASYLLLLFLLLLFIYFQKSIANSSSEHTKKLFLFWINRLTYYQFMLSIYGIQRDPRGYISSQVFFEDFLWVSV